MPPAIHITTSTFPRHLVDLRESQEANAIHQEEDLRKKGSRITKGKGYANPKGKGRPRRRPQMDEYQDIHEYNGIDTECSICVQDFQQGEKVFRLTCNHVFHEDCWQTVHLRQTTADNAQTAEDQVLRKLSILTLVNQVQMNCLTA